MVSMTKVDTYEDVINIPVTVAYSNRSLLRIKHVSVVISTVETERKRF